MEIDRARELAIAEFSKRLAGEADEWQLAGSREGDVRTLDGVHRHLIFQFVPRHPAPGSLDLLEIAVDPKTGQTRMLR